MRIPTPARFLLLALVVLAISAPSFAEVSISVQIGPPALPVYVQPPCPAEGYIWTPGYWGYDYEDGDYYWVPGTWVLAPHVGFFWTPGYWAWDPAGGYYWVPGTWVLAPVPGYLWTPGYWRWSDDAYIWNEGYWGPTVGFYGGINYGFGYVGEG